MKKIFLLAFVMLLLVGTVSAAEWDNVKSYDPITKTVTVDNALGLPFISDEIASIKLLTPLNMRVGLGYQKVAEFEITGFTNYDNLFGEMEFYDVKKGMEEEEILFDYKYKSYYNLLVDDYKEVCSVSKINESLICENIVIGNHLEERWRWEYLTLENIKENEVLTIGIFTNTQEGDIKEWIPNLFGVRVNEWAVWTAALDVGLVSYYALNETSGPVLDSQGSNDMINSGAIRGIAGKIDNQFGFNGIDMNISTLTNPLSGIGGDDWSFNIWVNASEDNIGQVIVIGANIAGSTDEFIETLVVNGVLNVGVRANFVSVNLVGGIIYPNNLSMFTLTRNSTGVSLFVNGILEDGPSPFSESFGPLFNDPGMSLGKAFHPTVFRWLNGSLDELGIWNRSLSQAGIIQLLNNNNGLNFFERRGVVVTLNSPIDNFGTSSPTIEFNGSAVSELGVINVTLILDDVFNETNTSGINDTYYTFTKTFGEGIHTWNYQSCNSIGCENGTERTFIIDATAPTISVDSPSGLYVYLVQGDTLDLNYTATDPFIDSCWVDYNGTNSTITCGVNTTITLKGGGDDLRLYANDSAGNINSSYIKWFYQIFVISEYYNTSSYETASEDFIINLFANATLTSTTLNFGSVDHASTNSGTNFTSTFDLPTSTGNKTFYWDFVYGADRINSTLRNQSVNYTAFGLCNTTYTHPYVNLTFKDEENVSGNINATIDASTWDYWLGDGSVAKQLLFSNSTANDYYPFCFEAGNLTMKNNVSVQYASLGYPQRKFDSTADLTNTTTNKILYLLGAADGIYSNIQVIDSKGNRISGVSITAERDFSGVPTIIGQETTDDAGSVTMWVNPDYDHTFTFSGGGCIGTSITIRPTQTQYTQQLVCGATGDDFVSSLEGIKYARTPSSGIIQQGLYNFTYQLVSSKSNIVNASFSIINKSNDAILNTTYNSCAPAGCTIYFLYTVPNDANFYGIYYLDIGNGFFLLEGDAHWMTVDIDSGIGGFKTIVSDIMFIFEEWGDDENTQDFNRLITIFFFMCIAISFLNYNFNADSLNPGAFMTLLTVVIVMGSLVGGTDSAGLFYFNNLSGSTIFNNYILAIISGVMTLGYFIGINRRNQ